MNDAPLAGIRVLALEQAVALPVGTRHLADMGADVIRVQSHVRSPRSSTEIDLTRNKRQLALDLSVPGAVEAFLRVASQCDVLAHNFTPRVVRRFGIAYEDVRQVNPDVIYVSLTGFGTTGQWGERPLFGPGAEAVSGHNMLIGEPDSWPGRPGTIVYADSTCGLNAAFAVVAALDRRERTGDGQHIDISLYETSVAQLGPVMAEAQLGAIPTRVGNADVNFAIHGVFQCAGHDRHVAVAIRAEQLAAACRVLGLAEGCDRAAVAVAVSEMSAENAAELLQSQGIAAHIVADACDLSSDAQLWSRGFFGIVERVSPGVEPGRYPHIGPAWGGGPAVPMEEARPVGADSRQVLTELGGCSSAEVDALIASGATSEASPEDVAVGRAVDGALRIERGELSRLDAQHDGWRRQAAAWAQP